MALNKLFFSKKITKNCPHTPVCDTSKFTGFLKTSPKLRICIFQLYLFKPSLFAKSWLSANRQIFDDVIACDLWFRPSQSKILATPINWWLPEKLFFEDHFFLENTCGCVLGPWPRAFLFLASRGSVLGKAVLGLGLGFFFVSLASSHVSSTPPLVRMSPFVSILADETTDISCKVQFSLVYCYIFNGSVIERFICFNDVSGDKSASAISSLILKYIKYFANCGTKLVAQTFDGAAVMSSALSGVQSKI